jgi:predicted TIM-barrel fold metal-dependent hydrolase
MYNRWLAEFVSADPDRLIGLADIPVWDIDAAVAEIKAARKASLRGVNFPAPRARLLSYNRAEYDRLWAACVENNMSLHSHGGGGGVFAVDGGTGAFSITLTEMFFAGRRGMWQMIFGGVFERFPELRLWITEQAGCWVVDTLQNLGSIYMSSMQERESPHIREVLPRRPSEYFHSNVYIGASFMSRPEAQATIDAGYWRNIALGT